jgi:hypothetical protein
MINRKEISPVLQNVCFLLQNERIKISEWNTFAPKVVLILKLNVCVKKTALSKIVSGEK